ncbi:MAG: ribosome silencing factor [Burkholderiales bacterium]|nr:ribosome silencing factor [Burkholderiales bacterium]
MDIKKLQSLVIDALEDVKAQDIRLFDTMHLTSLFDRIVIASGTSNRQTKALAASVRDKVKAQGSHILSIEGETTGEWVLVDLGDMIVHIMQPAIRAYYRLEEIWGEKEIKLGAAKRKPSTGTKITSHILGSTPTKTTASTTPARKTATKTAPKTATKSSTKTASKTARKSAGKTATRSPAVKKTAAKKVVAKKTVSKTAVKKTSATTSTRTASKSSSPKRTAVKKSK